MEPNDPGMMGAVSEGILAADTQASDEAKAKAKAAEESAVKALWKEFEEAREFDKTARAQYAVDRRYAAGTAHLDWAVSANLIGAFIDILVSFLYARNPDVSGRKTPRVDNLGTQEEDDLAKTMELVVSALWQAPSAALKRNARSMVRSTLSVGVGWLKAIVVSGAPNIPQMKTQLNDIRDNMAMLAEVKECLSYQAQPELPLEAPQTTYVDTFAMTPEEQDAATAAPMPEAPAAPAAPTIDPENKYAQMSQEEIDVETARMQELEASISNRLEVAMRKGMAVDYVAAEDIQVSLDVRSLADYLNAGWIANTIYRPCSSATAMFPRLSETDVKSAKVYNQRQNKALEALPPSTRVTGIAGADVNPDEAEQYTAGEKNADANTKGFVRVVELWNRETGHVHTMIDGVHKWAKEPYQPDYPTTRFYPYFLTAFYPADGARHPQSLSQRLAKLMDEYCAMRSSLRLVRQRAAPGVLFNSSAISPEEAKKIERSVEQEFTGIKPTNPDMRLADAFAPKPVEVGDMRLYDASMILSDMERISGVQEALQQANTSPKTATEAEIQQTGFASRTTADRDVLEDALNDLAHYTAELSINALEIKDVQRIAGPKAYWPHGMSVDDLLTMVEVDIEAGTTGKPKTSGDKDAWGVVMPMIQSSMMQIRQALMIGDTDMAQCLTNLLQETMHRMGDETDVSKFIPKALPAPMPGVPGAPGMPPGAPGMPPDAGMPPGAMPPDAGLVDPNIQAPPGMAPPDLQAMM